MKNTRESLLRQLIDHLASGECEERWKEMEVLVRLYVSRTFKTRRQSGPTDEEDIVQEILLVFQDRKILKKIEQARSPESYLAVLVRNKANDTERRRKLDQKLSMTISGEAAPILEETDDIEKESRLAALEQELRILSKSDRELLKLHFWKGYTIAEIAVRYKVPYSRTAVRLFRLLRRLRERVSTRQAV
jgi:RNA polymerase sigma factor (sigma-70 family)